IDSYEYRLLDTSNVDPLAGALLTLKPDPNAWYYSAGDDWSTYANNMPAPDAEPQTVTSDDAGRFFFDEVYCGAWYILEAKKDGYFPVTMILMGHSVDDSVSVMLRKIKVVPELPDGIDLTVQTGKDTYALGETVEFIVSLTNTTQNDIQMDIIPKYPLKYMVNRVDSLYEQWMYIPETETITIPAGGYQSYNGRLNGPWYEYDVMSSVKPGYDYNSDGQIDTESDSDALYRSFAIAPGTYTLNAGLIGYKNWVSTEFTVSDQLLMGTLSGVVITHSSNRRMSESEPLSGVTLTLSPAEYLLGNVRLQEKWVTESNEDGTFVIENVPVGLGYRLQADIEGFYTYYEYLTLFSPDTHMKVWLKRNEPMPPTPMAIDRRTFEGLTVTFGTDRSVYEPGAAFEAMYTIKNERTEPVTFTFDNDNFIEWNVVSSDRDTLWSYTDTFYNEFEDENNSGEAPAATFEFTLNPGEAREFTWKGSLGEVISKTDSKYIVSGQLAFRKISIEGLTADKTKCSLIVIVTINDSIYYRVDEDGAPNIEADFGESFGASLDCTMKNNVDGSAIRVTKVERNVHTPLENHRYITMYEVDADLAVREELSNARIRIYYDPAELGDDVDPKTLVIAHWTDNSNWDGSNDDMVVDTANGTWEILESSVNQEQQYVEANATSFSSFALFEAFEQTGVEENNVSRSFTLMQNSPNPFNPVTAIQFTLPDAGIVRIDVYNMAGQKVYTIADEFMSAGSHSVMWNAQGFSAGVYFCTVQTAGSSKSMKMTLLK
ncbi:T9SS type A sorting domain-containing protein, partial [Candidatus Omnitrophota bacterium]